MTSNLLTEHFDRICDAPDAIPRLRRFVLDLAVRGKLVEQEPDDEPASELLKRITAEKSQLAREGIIPHSKPSSQPRADELPFDLKPGWQPARFSQILVEIQTGPFGSSLHQSDYEKNGIPVINPASIKNGRLIPVPGMAVGPQTIARLAGFKLRENDVVMARRGEMGRCAIVSTNEEGWLCGTGSLILRLAKCLFPPFIVLLIGSPLVREYLNSSAVGATMQNLNQGILLNLVMALPPLTEQRRIVAMVGELMTLCDQLEAARAEREKRRSTLVAAANHHLTNGDDPKDFRAHAGFYFNNLPLLTICNKDIDRLRQSIRDLAVRGKLAPQEPNDGFTSAQVENIRLSKAKLVEKGILRKERPMSEVSEADIPFSVPANWSWVRLGTCALSTEYGTSVKSDQAEIGIPVLKMGDIQDGKVFLGGQKKVPSDIDDLPHLLLKRFDLLYNRTNSAELVGKTGIYQGDDDAYTFASYLIRIRFMNEFTSSEFVNLAMNSSYFRVTQIEPQLQQQCGQANVNGTKLRDMLIPLPPVSEQHRIVSKVNGLMTICDLLEERIVEGVNSSRKLLEAVLNSALQGSAQSVLEAAL